MFFVLIRIQIAQKTANARCNEAELSFFFKICESQKLPLFRAFENGVFRLGVIFGACEKVLTHLEVPGVGFGSITWLR